MIKVEAHIVVQFGAHPEDAVRTPIKVQRILFEETCMIFGFHGVEIPGGSKVTEISVNGEVCKCEYRIEEKSKFFPGFKYYYPSSIVQAGHEVL